MFRMIASLLLFVATTALAGPGYWTSNGPWGGVIYAIHPDPGNAFTLYAATRGGLFRTLDGGVSWVLIENGMAGSSRGAAFAIDADAAGHIYSFDDYGRLYRSTDFGDNWTPTAFVVPANHYPTQLRDIPGGIGKLLLAMAGSSATSTEVMVKLSTDSGTTFSATSGIPVGTPFARIEIDPTNPNLVLAGTEADYPEPPLASAPFVLYRSTDGGANFVGVMQVLPNPGYYVSTRSVAFGAGSRVYVATQDLGLLRSDDDGASWNTLGTAAERLIAHPSIADEVYSADFGFARSTNGGTSFAPSNTGLNPNPTYFDPGTALAVPAQSEDLVAGPGFPAPGSALWFASNGGGIFRSTDGGASWSSSGVNDGLAAVNLRAVLVHPNPSTLSGGVGQRIYAGFSDAFLSSSGMYASTSGGSSWALSHNNLEAATIRSLLIDPLTAGTAPAGVASSRLFASGRSSMGSARARNGGLYRSVTGGLSWAKLEGDLPRRGTPPNDYVDIGTVRDIRLDPRSCTIPLSPTACTSGTLKRMVATGNGHRPLPVGGVTTYTHRIIRSDNVDTLAVHPVRGTIDVNWTDISGDLTPATSSSLLSQTITPVHVLISATNPDLMYVGTYKGYFDHDHGDATPLADLHSGVFKTTNGGVNWVPVNTGLPRIPGYSNTVYDVLSLEMHPANHDTLWASVINLDVPNSASIYKTTDGGATWSESASGIASRVDIRDIMVDPGDPSIVYAAGAGTPANPGSIYRSTDGGANWLSISIGLPADAALALTLDPFNPSLLHAGTNSGLWSLTQVPDTDGDGIPDGEENNVLNGDGNGDGLPDAAQRDVGSTGVIFRGPAQVTNTGQATIDVRTELSTPSSAGGCSQATDMQRAFSVQHGRDYVDGGPHYYRYLREMMRFEVQHCSQAIVDLVYHGSNFTTQYGWSFRFRGPSAPGDDGSIGWYAFGTRAALLSPTVNTWRLTLDANQFGSYRPVNDSILFMGGPACLDDRLLGDGFETTTSALPACQ